MSIIEIETRQDRIDVGDEPKTSVGSSWVATVALVAVGASAVGVRLRWLVIGRSLWLDEAMLALNICGRSFADLTKPLDDDQGAPVGFLFAERLAVLAFGPEEWALRLIPFLAGLTTLALIHRLVTAAGWGRWSGVVGVALAATSPTLLYYSTEVKQYSSDIAIGLALMILALPVLRTGWTTPRALILVIVGASAVWFSHPSIFILAGVGATLFVQAALDRRPAAASLTVLVSVAWLTSFAVEYFWLLRDLQANDFLADYWKSGFLRVPPRSTADLRNYSAIGFGLFETLFQSYGVDVDLGPRMGCFFAAAWLVGLAVSIQMGRTRDQRWWLALVVAPLGFAVLASILGKYPLKGRLAIFTAASTLPVIASGIAALWSSRDALNRSLAAILLGVALLLPSMQAAQLLVERPRLHDARGVLAAMTRDWRPGDLVIVDRYSSPPFRFYQKYGKIAGLEAVTATTSPRSLCEPEDLADEIRRHRGEPRAWFLLDTALPDPVNFSRAGLRVQLDEAGTRLASFSCRRYSAHLYRLDPPPRTAP